MVGPGVAPGAALRLVLFGDGPWAANSLRCLHESAHAIAAVVVRTQPSDRSLTEACEALGIPVFAPENVNAPTFVSVLQALEADLALSVSYNQIVRRPVLESARLGMVNFHAGKLPYYRGRNVVNWAIINGESEIGLTAHYVDEGIDTGDIILQRTLPIGWTDTYGDVLGRVVNAFPSLVADTVRAIASGTATRTPQAHLPGTYFGGRGEGDEWLDWSDTSVNLHNKIRAITRPGPGARTLVGGRTVVIWRAYCDPSWPRYLAIPGQVVGRREDGVVVKTGDSTLLVHEVQVDGETPTVPQWRIGTRLGLDPVAALCAMQARTTAHEIGRS